MNKIAVYRPNLPALEPQRVLQGLDHHARGFVPTRMPVLVVTKLFGGAGTDTLLSMIVHWLTQWTVPPLIVQAGGAQGPLSRGYQSDLFQMFQTLDKEVMAKTFDAIVNCQDRPVLVAIDHNLNLAFIEMLRSMKSAQLSIRIVCMHLMRTEQEELKILRHFRDAGAQVAGATKTPSLDDSVPSNVVLIPKLPRHIASMISEQNCSFTDAIATATPGTQLMMRQSLERFFASMKVIYARDI